MCIAQDTTGACWTVRGNKVDLAEHVRACKSMYTSMSEAVSASTGVLPIGDTSGDLVYCNDTHRI